MPRWAIKHRSVVIVRDKITDEFIFTRRNFFVVDTLGNLALVKDSNRHTSLYDIEDLVQIKGYKAQTSIYTESDACPDSGEESEDEFKDDRWIPITQGLIKEEPGFTLEQYEEIKEMTA